MLTRLKGSAARQLTACALDLRGARDGQQKGLGLDGGQHDVQIVLGRRLLAVCSRGHWHMREGAQGWHSNRNDGHNTGQRSG